MSEFMQRILRHAERAPDALAVEAVSARRGSQRRTRAEVIIAARRAAANLRAKGVGAGQRVVLIGTHHIDFYGAWLGAVWLGAVPCVLAEPSVRMDRTEYELRLTTLLQRIGAKALLCDPRLSFARNDALPPLVDYAALVSDAGAVEGPPVTCDEQMPLLLQHSSGTTGIPKGVQLSHGAVLRHFEAYAARMSLSEADTVVTWLPLYHDMGLVACFITPLLVGAPVIWLSPFEWVTNPGSLLSAIGKHRATVVWLPNFAFYFLAERVRADANFDLSSLRAVVDCSEPVSADALRVFRERFSSAGLAPSALHTCYAMAENVFVVSTSSASDPPRELQIDAGTWRKHHQAVAATAPQECLTLLSSGALVPGCEVRILDEAGARLPPCAAGRIMLASPFLFDGYFGRPAREEGVFDADGFYETGDVGFIDEAGHLYVTGRLKDLIIVGGKNIYPQELERAAERVEGVYAGRVVAFGVDLAGRGTEGIVILAESEVDPSTWDEIASNIRRAVARQLDADVSDARVVPRATLRKSTSGKLARARNRDDFLSGAFDDPSQAKSREE